jgi:zinc/manganese transport system substrate-binding protein
MLKTRLINIGLLLLLPSLSFAQAEAAIRVVASFSILGDLAAELGGEHVDVVTLVGPDSDGHLYQPTPGDGRAVSTAEVVIINGLHFEGWISRLLESSGYSGAVAVASEGIQPLMKDGEADPHAWQSLVHIRRYTDNITRAYAARRPGLAGNFEMLKMDFIGRVERLSAEAQIKFMSIPADRRLVVTSHDAFGYLGHEFGIRFLAPAGLSTEEQPSAAGVARLITQIRRDRIRAMFVENIADPRLIEQVARETGARMGGRLYSDALSEKGGVAETYLKMMRYNLETIHAALSSSAGP